jgi:DNA-directed RNA polymerase specialized sigma24 family protein
MAAYATGDDYAFAELFRSCAPILTRSFMRRGKRSSDAQDLVQQMFLHVHRARSIGCTPNARASWRPHWPA